MLASLLYPYDDDAPKRIGGWLDELEREGCIRRYQVGTDTYLESLNWLKHQKIDKPSPSRLPPFDEASRIVAKPREASTPDLVPSTLDLGPRTKTLVVSATFDDFWKVCPKKVGKGAAEKSFAKATTLADPTILIKAMLTYAGTQAGKDPAYTAHPATWLNQKRWLDEPDKPNGNGSLDLGVPPELAARIRRAQESEETAQKEREAENVH